MTSKLPGQLALVGIVILLLPLSGCLIKGPTKPPNIYSMLQIQPDYSLEAAPAGRVYQMWTLSLDSASGTFGGVTPLRYKRGQESVLFRFQWDPVSYRALDPDDSLVVLPLTKAPGVDVGINLRTASVLFLTVEPENDPHPDLPDGPSVLADVVLPAYESGVTLYNPFELIRILAGIGGISPGSYTLISQSNKKGTGGNWRDGSEGNGIWFCRAEVDNRIVIDTVGFQTYQEVIIPTRGTPYPYNVWINTKHKDSSFSDFGKVFGTLDTLKNPRLYPQEPDLRFVDGVPKHDLLKRGPQMPLGTDMRILPSGDTIYRYYSPVTQVCGIVYDSTCDCDTVICHPVQDTCDLNVTHPELTHSTRDAFTVRHFEKRFISKREFTTTGGDTTMTPTMGVIADLDALGKTPRFAGIFNQWEYETWLVFSKSSGIKPLSMGRFRSPTRPDTSNRYTFTDSRFDRNFQYPGEDFLQNLPDTLHPTLHAPLNVIDDRDAEKIWITIEPLEQLDWAPDEPNTQMIYYSGWIPHTQLTTEDSPERVLVPRDPNSGPESLTEGHRFPTMRVIWTQPPVE